jgi:hypothetical protein
MKTDGISNISNEMLKYGVLNEWNNPFAKTHDTRKIPKEYGVRVRWEASQNTFRIKEQQITQIISEEYNCCVPHNDNYQNI